MANQPVRVEGSCLCGTVAFHVALPTLFCAHCHCSMCQRNHGSAYVTWFGVPNDQLEIDTGADALVRYASSEHGSRTFCGRCGSSLFCENTEHPGHTDVPLANMHGEIDRVPQFHSYFDDHAAWLAVGDELPRLGGKTGTEPIES
jgi:hypothetical protein